VKTDFSVVMWAPTNCIGQVSGINGGHTVESVDAQGRLAAIRVFTQTAMRQLAGAGWQIGEIIPASDGGNQGW
jgi:hypothetical protein